MGSGTALTVVRLNLERGLEFAGLGVQDLELGSAPAEVDWRGRSRLGRQAEEDGGRAWIRHLPVLARF